MNNYCLWLQHIFSQPSSQNKKVLLEAAQQLESAVLVPLSELAQSTLFSYELLQETHRAQLDILNGVPGAAAELGGVGKQGSSGGGDRAGSGMGMLSVGVKQLVVDLKGEHGALAARVQLIQEKFAVQKEKAEKQLAAAISQRAKVGN